ncbi:MAG TPA: hypothetical protein VIN09_09555 [Chloroflexota bacterium]
MTTKLVIPRCPPRSFNQFVRLHWARRRKIVELWRQEVAVAAAKAGRPRFERAVVRLRLFYDRRPLPDWDNAQSAASKVILDGLVRAGVLPDDEARYVRGVTLVELGVDRTNPRVEIEVTAVEA